MKTLILSLFLVFGATSCTTHRLISSLSISTTLEEDPLRIGSELTLEINAIDNDGIASVSINIEALNVSNIYRNINGKEWDYEQHFIIAPNTKSGTSEIIVTLIDTYGNTKIKATSLLVAHN